MRAALYFIYRRFVITEQNHRTLSAPFSPSRKTMYVTAATCTIWSPYGRSPIPQTRAWQAKFMILSTRILQVKVKGARVNLKLSVPIYRLYRLMRQNPSRKLGVKARIFIMLSMVNSAKGVVCETGSPHVCWSHSYYEAQAVPHKTQNTHSCTRSSYFG